MYQHHATWDLQSPQTQIFVRSSSSQQIAIIFQQPTKGGNPSTTMDRMVQGRSKFLDDRMQQVAIPRAASHKNDWSHRFFGALKGFIWHLRRDRYHRNPGTFPSVYTLQEGFLPQDRSWIPHVQDSPMSLNSRILYRPDIVKSMVDMIDQIYEERARVGLLVTGPPGIGKSYSLVNLARYLLASGRYWVTIIPDSDNLRNATDLINFLLRSVGVKVDDFRCTKEDDNMRATDLKALIEDIDNFLSKHGMKWVFAFDIVGREDYQETTRDASMLPYPFQMISKYLKGSRIISVISLSANNKALHEEDLECFEEFEHPSQFSRGEITSLYPPWEMAQWKWQELEYATGRVPWYLDRWTKETDYLDKVRDEIEVSLKNLQREKHDSWNDFKSSAIQCVPRSLTYKPLFFDCKFSMLQKERENGTCVYRIVALFPLVEEAYRDYFWDDFCGHVNEKFGGISVLSSSMCIYSSKRQYLTPCFRTC